VNQEQGTDYVLHAAAPFLDSTIEGALGSRIRQKLFCEKDLSRFGGVARRSQSVVQNRACLDRSKGCPVVAAFNGGALRSDASGLLLCAALLS